MPQFVYKTTAKDPKKAPTSISVKGGKPLEVDKDGIVRSATEIDDPFRHGLILMEVRD